MRNIISTCVATAFTSFLGASVGLAHAETPASQTQGTQASGKSMGTLSTTSTSSGSSGTSGDSAASSKSKPVARNEMAKPTAVFMLVPIEIANSESAKKEGCWAKVYDKENFMGDQLLVMGPNAIADMDQVGLFGQSWEDRVESVELGPKATLTVYDNENYKDMVKQFEPGQRIADVSKRTGFFDEFSSIKLECKKT